MTGPDGRCFADATALVDRMRRPLLVSHARPDGDAIGSLVAMRSVLRGRGKEPTGLVFDAIPDRYRFLVERDPLSRLGENVTPADLDAGALDGVIILDTCTYNQLAPLADWLRESAAPKLVVDHHVTRDDLAQAYLIDESAAATALLLHDWFGAAGWSVDPPASEALYVGIATDTGWFRHSNTDARALAAAAELVRSGVRPSTVYDLLFQQESVARFRLRTAAARTLELHANERLALQAIPQSVFADTGAALADTEDLVNEPLRIGCTVLSVMLVDQGDGVTRVGFRSRAPIDDQSPDIDVSAIARGFGGGGHRRAAGARLRASLEEAKSQVVAAMTAVLG